MNICHKCIEEQILGTEIRKAGVSRICGICKRKRKSIAIIDIANRVEKIITSLFTRTAENPADWEYYLSVVDDESDYQWERDGQTIPDLLVDQLNLPEAIANDVFNILRDRHYDQSAAEIGEETDFDESVQYKLKPIKEKYWSENWENYKSQLITESRFFSQNAKRFLDSIFIGLENFKTYDGESVSGTAGPNSDISELYRARVFQSRQKLLDAIAQPDILMGPPSSEFAMNGRMNPRGISVFYGATEKSTALAEVRPPVGSNTAVAKFKIISPLTLIDLRKLNEIQDQVSLFDPNYIERTEKVYFMNRLVHLMTQPVMPDDEAFSYLPTQAIADYLATNELINCDGIIFPSVQSSDSGVNVVLFHKSSRVARIDVNNLKIYANDEAFEEDQKYVHFQVIEVDSLESEVTKNEEQLDTRIPTLEVDLTQIEIHQIKSIHYNTESHTVYRRKNDSSQNIYENLYRM